MKIFYLSIFYKVSRCDGNEIEKNTDIIMNFDWIHSLPLYLYTAKAHIWYDSYVKADMKSYKSLETAAIFYSSELFLIQGIS